MKRRHLLISVGALFLLFALGAEFIANDTAIIYEQDGHWKCGACMEWPGKIQPPTPDNARTILQPFIRFDANALSKESLYLAPPFSSEEAGTHWLGTDSQSRDVLAGIIYGTRYALLIGFISVFFALIVGTILGGMAAYYGDHRLRIAPAASLLFLISIGAFSYASYYQLTHILVGSMAITVVFILTLTLGQSENGISWPVNQWVTKGIELFDSLPALFVLLAFAATIQNWNIWTLSLLIAFFRWPTFARLTRSEMTPWANSAWIKALRDLEMPDLWIVRTQLLNLVIVPISIHAAFALAGAVSIEATLTFLGFGLGVETQSWGRLLSDARQYFQAWWLVVFPGLFLFIFLWWTNQMARYIQRKTQNLNP